MIVKTVGAIGNRRITVETESTSLPFVVAWENPQHTWTFSVEAQNRTYNSTIVGFDVKEARDWAIGLYQAEGGE